MQVNSSASATLPINGQPSKKSITSTPEKQQFAAAVENHQFTSITLGSELTPPDPESVHRIRLLLAESSTGLKGEEALSQYKKNREKTMALMGPETREHHASPAELEKQLQTQVDSIFRGPAGNILAVVYKDGSAETHANIDLSALAASAKGLSEHEYRAAMRNGVAAALGSRAVASYYDYHKPAPTMKDIIREEQAFRAANKTP